MFPHLEHAEQSQKGEQHHHRLQKNESGLGEQGSICERNDSVIIGDFVSTFSNCSKRQCYIKDIHFQVH